MNYSESIEQERMKKDNYFKNQHYSPLTEEQSAKFSSLDYFGVKEDLKFTVELKEYSQKQEVDIRTSTGVLQTYIRHGYIAFEIDGVISSLTVYLQPNSDYLFVPFKDKTSGTESYGAGRYIELEKNGKDQYVLDFNSAYNPYCAYNDQWTCPLTPFENILKVEIKAGEKSFGRN
ncbi:MAG: DUF1684 domain-containing protein [Candidatus Heimdallarchaeota archaeon]|nr:DUF1684 domain-containing protein [Candidatus Heimdallarchaeota archaeon]